MSLKCYFQYDDGRFRKNWAMHGTRFCSNQQPHDAGEEVQAQVTIGLAPIQLQQPRDLFQLVGDALNSLRTGSTSPGRAYATCCLARLWLELYAKLKSDASDRAFFREFRAALAAQKGEPEPPPDPGPAAAFPPPAPPRDPWAAGRVADPEPSPDTAVAAATLPQPITLAQARSELNRLPPRQLQRSGP